MDNARGGPSHSRSGTAVKQKATLLRQLHRTSKAIATACDEVSVSQALIGFAVVSDIDAACLLVFSEVVNGRPTAIEMPESWTRANGPAQPRGTPMSLADSTLLGHLSAESTFACEDMASDGRIDEAARRFLSRLGLASFVAIPLTAGQAISAQPAKDWLGTLIIGRAQSSVYDDELIYAWWTLAGQAAANMQNARQRHREQALLLDSSATISGSIDLDTALHATAREIATALQANGCTISTWDPDQDALVIVLDYSTDPGQWEPQAQGTVYRLAEYPISRQVLADRQPLAMHVSDPDTEPTEKSWMEEQGVQSLLMAPLVAQDTATGLLELWWAQEGRHFTYTEIALCQALANQAAAALENAGLFKQLRRRSLQLQTAAEVSRITSSMLDQDHLIRRAVDLVGERFGLDYVGLFLVDSTGEWAVLCAGTGEAGRIQLQQGHKLSVGGESVIGWCVANAQARCSQDVLAEGTRLVNPLLPETRSELALPLISRGQVIGAMAIHSSRIAAFSDDDISVLQRVADQLANVIQNARLFEERSQRSEELATLNLITTTVSRSLEMQGMLDAALMAVIKAFGFDAGLISLSDEASGQLYLASFQAVPEPLVKHFKQHGLGETLCEVVFQTGDTLGLGDIRQEAPRDVSALIGHGLLAFAGTPLAYQNQTLGTLCLFSGSVRNVSSAKLSLMEAVGRQIGTGIQNARLYEKTQARAEELAALFKVSQEFARTFLQPRQIAEIVARQIVVEMEDVECSLALLEPDGDTLRVLADLHIEEGGIARSEESEETFRLSDYPATARVMETLQPLVVQAAASDADAAELAYMRAHGSETLAIFPLAVKGQAIGVLGFESQQTYHYTPEQLSLIMTLSNQAAAALENSRLFEETQTRAQHEQQLWQLLATINASGDLIADLPRIAQRMYELAPADVVELTRHSPGDSEFAYFFASPKMDSSDAPQEGIRVPLENSGHQWAIAHKAPWLSADIREKRVFSEDERLIARGVVARLILPLEIGDRVIGTLSLGSSQPGAFTEKQLPVLRQVAIQFALALERAYLLKETQAALAEVEAAHRRYLHHEWESVLSTNPDRVWGYLDGPDGIISIDEFWTPEIKESVATGELTTFSQSANGDGSPTRSAMALPIKLRGQIIGVLDFYDEERVWTEEDKLFASTLADQISLALENARLFDKTMRSASRERLTSEIVAKIRAAGDIQSILETAAVELSQAMGVSRARISLGGPQDQSQPARDSAAQSAGNTNEGESEMLP